MKFAHIQDVHLGYKQYGLSERSDDFYQAWKWACYEIVKAGCSFVILCGDLFNHRDVKPLTYMEAVSGLKLLKKNGVRVYAIEGNHEQMRDNSLGWVDVLAQEGYIDRSQVSFDSGMTISGLDWSKGETATRLKETWWGGPQHILMVHAAYEPFTPFKVPEIVSRDLLQSLDVGYIGIGHIHWPFDDGKVHSCGSLETWSIKELEYPDRGFNIVTYEDGEYKVERVVTPKREFGYVRINASDCTTKQQALSKVRQDLLDTNQSFRENILTLSLDLPDVGISEREVLELASEIVFPLHIRLDLKTIKDTTIKESITRDTQLYMELADTPLQTWNKVVEEVAKKNKSLKLP